MEHVPDQGKAWRLALWNVARGRIVHTREHIYSLSALAFTPNGQLLAAVGGDNRIYFWNAGMGAEVRNFPVVAGACSSLAFSPNGKSLALAKRGQGIWLYDTATGRKLHLLRDKENADCRRPSGCSPDGELLATPTRANRNVSVLPFCFSPDGKLLAAAANQKTCIQLWEVESGQEVRRLETGERTACLAFSPDGRTLASSAFCHGETKPHSIRLWDVAAGQERGRLKGPLSHGTHALVFSRDGQHLFSAGLVGEPIRIWDWVRGQQRLAFAEHESSVRSLAFSPDGRTLATGGADGVIRLWEPRQGKLRRHFEDRPFSHTKLAFSRDGRTLLSSAGGGFVRAWDTASSKQRRMGKVQGNESGFVASSDGRMLATPGNGAIYLWDATTGEELRQVPTGAQRTYPCLCGPEGAGQHASRRGEPLESKIVGESAEKVPKANAQTTRAGEWNRHICAPSLLFPSDPMGTSAKVVSLRAAGQIA